MENGKENILKWVGALVGIGSVGSLILTILNSNASEALKYFAITIVFFIALILYIELVVKKTVKETVKV